MRDLTGQEVVRKRDLQRRLLQTFGHCGYEEVMSPAIEYVETYSSAFSSLQTSDMYKFFDENGEILALRMDMTVPIARMAATRFRELKGPLRFCYTSNVYKVRKTFAGKRSEVMDCGIELIGGDEQADLEVLFVALQALDALDLSDAVLEISDVNFFFDGARSLLKEEDVLKLAGLIDNKSMVELEDFLASLPIEEDKKAFTKGQADALVRLSALYDELRDLNRADRIRFDFGKLPHLDYYTGLIFEGYIPGVGTSILSGGRYDRLLESFGRPDPAVGFSVKIDYLCDLYETIEQPYVKIRYPKGGLAQALAILETCPVEAAVKLEQSDDPACVQAEVEYVS